MHTITILIIIQYIIIAGYLLALFFLPRGYWATHQKLMADPEAKRKIDENKLTRQIAETEVFRRFFESSTSTLAVDAEWIREKLYKAIDYAIRRHDWYEDQRSRLFRALVVILTISGTCVGLVLKEDNHTPFNVRGMLPIIIVIFVSTARAIIIYNHNLDADRPYRLVADIRFWYFRYNFPDHSERLTAKPDLIRVADRVLEERSTFLARIEECLDPIASLREDFEQLFILHILQRYKSESLQKLRWLVSYTAAAIVSLSLLSLVILSLLKGMQGS